MTLEFDTAQDEEDGRNMKFTIMLPADTGTTLIGAVTACWPMPPLAQPAPLPMPLR